MSALRTISTEELAARLDTSTPFHFWNVLPDEYFQGDFIPGSQRLPVDAVAKTMKELRLPLDAEIVVYCWNPACPSSGQAAGKLSTLGYTNVRAYEGGLEQWMAAGHQVTKRAVASITVR